MRESRMNCPAGGYRLVSSKQRDLLLAFLVSASLSLCGATTARTDASIVIDASTTLAQSASGNDLETLQSIFQGANIPPEPAFEPARTLLKQIMTDLKMK